MKTNCRIKIEAEANYASGQLLFLGDRFSNEANDYSISIETIKILAKLYGNTITSTLYRFIEQAYEKTPMFGVICDHWFNPSIAFDYRNPCEHLIFSESFSAKFSDFNALLAFEMLRGYCKENKRGHLGEREVTIVDDNGDAHYFKMESFSNSYKILTLAVYLRPASITLTF